MLSLETFTDSKANEEKKKGKGKGCERPVGNHPRTKETKKEPSLERVRKCACQCGYSEMITLVRDDDPAYAGMKWMPCSCRSCGPTDATGRQQCDVTVGGFCALFLGAFCQDCREHQDNDKVD
jgi:hypothetical protein